tara:strand:+ start:486 stop:680 length:195 start_codon:yes stop_codon:yes gene_type:complete
MQYHQELKMLLMADQVHQTILRVQQHFMVVVALDMDATQAVLVVVEVIPAERRSILLRILQLQE